MNVVISNEATQAFGTLDIDIIKSVTGVHSALEIAEMFKSFFFNKMILDVTAVKGCENPDNFKTLVKELDPDKIILYIPDQSKLCTANFLSKLVAMGIYNFTTNIDGVKYLLKKSNSYEDVARFKKAGDEVMITNSPTEEGDGTSVVVGFRSVTEDAGATTLIYMMKKELERNTKTQVIGIEVDKNDFVLFNDNNLISVKKDNLRETIAKYSNAIVLVDMNTYPHDEACNTVFYLIEPSIVKLNKAFRVDSYLFNRLKNKYVVLNKSLLSNSDISEFEIECNTKVYYSLPPLDERQSNPAITEFLNKIGLLGRSSPSNNEGKVFGLFRR